MSKMNQAPGGDAKPLAQNSLESLSSAAKTSAPKGIANPVPSNKRSQQGQE